MRPTKQGGKKPGSVVSGAYKDMFHQVPPWLQNKLQEKKNCSEINIQNVQNENPTDASSTFIIILVRQGGLYEKNAL